MNRKTICNLLIKLVKSRNSDSDIVFTKIKDKYIPATLYNILKHIRILNLKLNQLGIKKSDRVAILSENRVEWICTDLACAISGIITVPIYNSLSKDQIRYIIEDSGSKVVFVSTSLLLERLLKIKEESGLDFEIISYNDFTGDERPEGLMFYNEIINEFESKGIVIEGSENINFINDKLNETDEGDLYSIIYTSGTTGNPKGVMLTNKNIYTNLEGCNNILEINERDIFLSFLPYSHAYERTAGYLLPFMNGAKIYYAQNIDTIGIQMPEVKPTFLITVPRLLDKMYNKVMKSGETLSGLRKKLFTSAIEFAHSENFDRKSFKFVLYDSLVYKKIKAKTGGNLRYFVSGGGALNKTINKFMNNIGLATLEGYGMTEASPVISVNRPEKIKVGTVGPVLKGVEVKIGEEGEILIKGDTIMKGYYKDEASSAESLKDGWLHSGDIGEIDEYGYIKITDRKKSLFKTSGGKYIAPTAIEEMILQIPYLDQAIVIGNGRMFVTALIVPEKDLKINEELYKKVEREIKQVTSSLSTYEKIRRFKLLDKPFTIEDGEMTPTMKLKRKVIEEKYSHIIEEMYKGLEG
ncbi:MAG: long-chain fatty acid--CoA ligase [Ignavibacteria bacterium]|nr:long-chain fatty acid--CoA ligase [Ignavibacteria bacterium]